MRKAIVILATSVAFLLSGQAFAVRQPVNMPLEGELIRGAETVDTIGDGIRTTKTLPTVNLNVAGKNLPVPVSAVRNIPSKNIATIAKNGLRANLPSLALQGTVAALVAGVGWVMTDGTLSKRIVAPPSNPSLSDYHWVLGTNDGSPYYNSATQACQANFAGSSYWALDHVSYENDSSALCWAKGIAPNTIGQVYVSANSRRFGSGCSAPAIWDSVSRSCQVYGNVPLSESDYDVLDGFIKGKDGVWQRGLASDICDSLPNPEQCYKGLVSDGTLTGPSTVTGSPTTTTSTSSTTNPDGTVTSPATSSSTKTPTITITYGDTYFDYSPTTTTITTTNNNGSTTTTTETEDGGIPDVPDSLAGINDPLGGLPGEIEGQGSSVSPLGYHSWFSMGGSCKEHSFDLPVIGVLTTNYCPIHEAYVRPFLAFMFALWTWHYCFQIWRESVTRVRAD